MEQPAGTEAQADVVGLAGERIESLLTASSVHGAVARERAEELVRQLTSLYGEGLARILRILESTGFLEQPLWDELVADDVVAGLLLIHGLHPDDVQTRVESALESVRPYLATHGGDVELLEVSDDAVVSLRLLGHCDGCPSSSVTLELAVESAVQAAAPEITSITVSAGAGKAASVGAPVIPVSALRTRLASEPARSSRMVAWVALPELGELGAGEVGGFSVSGTDLLACRIGSDLFVFADQCPRCEATMAGAQLQRRAGEPVGSGVLTCPRCRSHYDVRQAGAGIDTDGLHLTPLPLLLRDDVFTVALPQQPEPAPA